jgi:hypothetical protein
MRDNALVVSLRRKRDEIEAALRRFERLAEIARADLASVEATLALFETTDPSSARVYSDLDRLFARGELVAACLSALAREERLTASALALRIMRLKGLNAADVMLRKALARRIGNALTRRMKRGEVRIVGRRANAARWALRE